MSELELPETVLSKSSTDLRAELISIKKLFDVAGLRLTAVEKRLEPVEIAVAEIPSMRAHLNRVDAMLLDMQGDIRRMEKSTNAHSEKIEAKLDDLKALLLARRDA